MKKISTKIFKKVILTFTVMGTLFFLTGCGQNSDTLNVYNWGDYIDPNVIGEFTKETGIKVSYSCFNNNEELLAKVESNATSYDILFPSDYMVDIMKKKGLLEKLDYSNIPNAKYIDERFYDLDYDKGNQYSVPYMWQTVGITYNTKKVKEKVDSFDILWNPKYKRKIMILDSPRDAIGITLKKLGYSLNTTNMKELEEAKNALIEEKPLVLSYSVDYYKTALLSNEADIALSFSGDAMLINEENDDFEYVIPKEGTNLSVDTMVIPKQGKHKKEAEMFINFMNRPDIACKNADYIMYSSPNKGAIALMPEEIRNNQVMYPKGDLNKIGEIFKDLGKFNRVYDDIWTEVKTSN